MILQIFAPKSKVFLQPWNKPKRVFWRIYFVGFISGMLHLTTLKLHPNLWQKVFVFIQNNEFTSRKVHCRVASRMYPCLYWITWSTRSVNGYCTRCECQIFGSFRNWSLLTLFLSQSFSFARQLRFYMYLSNKKHYHYLLCLNISIKLINIKIMP